MDTFLKWYAVTLLLGYVALNIYGIHKLTAKGPSMADMMMAYEVNR
jgi:hypothetical protein